MKFFISYFYNVRFFSSNMLPLSTAQFDPKWYHDGKGNNNLYLDKNGVINGARATFLVPPKEMWDNLLEEDKCRKDCPLTGTFCKFMQGYYAHLNTVNFTKWLSDVDQYAKVLSSYSRIPIDTVVLLVHEPPYVKCAERPVLQRWFKEHGIGLLEWKKENS